MVNDLGGEWDGEGTDGRPAQQVVDEIIAAGGAAVANNDDIADWEGGQRLIQQAIDIFGGLDVLVKTARRRSGRARRAPPGRSGPEAGRGCVLRRAPGSRHHA